MNHGECVGSRSHGLEGIPRSPKSWMMPVDGKLSRPGISMSEGKDGDGMAGRNSRRLRMVELREDWISRVRLTGGGEW